MDKLKKGMYVRCSIDDEYPELPRRFALGQIIEYNELLYEVKVKFHELNNQLSMSDLYSINNIQVFPINEVVHCEVYPDVDVKINTSIRGSIICNADNSKDGYHHYYVQYTESGINKISVFCESQLEVSFSGSNSFPISQLKNYEFHNPVWYHNRQIVSSALHTLKSATFGFETLVGSRVFLMPHQVDTIVRAIGENPCRFMLADEVGLGKTIQAAVIKKGLEQRLGNMRVLIIAPESLVYQWKNEFHYKFWEDIPVWSEENYKKHPEQLIFPLEKVNTPEGILVLRSNWDLCIIDETHRLLNLDSEYNIIKRLSKRVSHLLLLSATPIQDRRTEYLKLLTLLQPEKYSDISEVGFNSLLEKQTYLSGKIHRLVRDLDDYYADELAEDYLDELEEIADELDDPILEKLVSNIDIDSEDEGLSAIRLAIAYIAEHYQIERKIIRHRRKELGEKLASRSLEMISYDMRGADELFYEYETYDMLLDYLNKFNKDSAEYKRTLLSAMFSSPFALMSALKERKRVITGNTNNTTTPVAVRSAIRSLEETSVIAGEEALLNELIQTTNLWRQANAIELTRLDELLDDPDLIKGRLMKVVDYISESLSNKIVIFTSWKETLLELEKVIANKFGSESVRSFYSGMNDQELQQSVDDFQKDPKCQFMLCDELGGEGRNFQMADEILHVDLPWSPSMLEQRIGRLDRIGRDKEVLSVVFVSEQTVEYDLFQLWNDGLNIFNESLSGLEIALGDINEQIDKALTTNICYGLSDVLGIMQFSLEDMRKKVEIERYYDMARQLDENVQEQLTNLIAKFDGNNGELLGKTMMSWAYLAGLNGISAEQGQVTIFRPDGIRLKSMRNTLLIPPFNMQEAHKRAKRTGEVRGTFNRRKAIEWENLIFYAPGDPFFDAIVDNATSSDLGRCCAFYQENTGINWKGFILTWSVSIDPSYLLETDQGLENLVLAQGYVPLEQIYTMYGYDELDQAVDEEAVKHILQSYDKQKVEHLGKRSSGRVKQFKELFPTDEWLPRVEQVYEQSYNDVKQRMSQMIDMKRAENDFQRRLDGMRAANLYFNKNEINDEEELTRLSHVYYALLKGLVSPKITLESAAFGWLVK